MFIQKTCNNNGIKRYQTFVEINSKKEETYCVSFQIRIKDSGRGISKENQDKLFLNFSKLADDEGLNK